ncbi:MULTISPECIES: hypothetical protein [Streptomyces]|uniref:hypothetical protein n=1 Tax=Streptomyces TaxID=1883 RepID=UPI0014053D59|nr:MULTISPECIES: hypothetical protein [Streptomyces]
MYYDSLKKKSNGYVPTDLADYDVAGDDVIDEELICQKGCQAPPNRSNDKLIP